MLWSSPDCARVAMSKQYGPAWKWLAVVLVLVTAAGMVSCGPTQTSQKTRVVVSVFPLADMVRNVGGNLVEVTTLLLPGVDLHTYEPTPNKIKDLARAKLFVEVGAGLEYWAEDMVKSSGNKDIVFVDTSKGVSLLQEEEGRANPHFWLDVTIAMKQVQDIRDALVQVDPNNKAVYERNTENYLAELEQLDRWIADSVREFSRKDFVSVHPTWDYFARRYGLNQVAVIEEYHSAEPSPAYIKSVVDAVKTVGVKALFAEVQFNPQAAQAIADETGAQVLLLDSMGGETIPGRDSYINMMKNNVNQMALALK